MFSREECKQGSSKDGTCTITEGLILLIIFSPFIFLFLVIFLILAVRKIRIIKIAAETAALKPSKFSYGVIDMLVTGRGMPPLTPTLKNSDSCDFSITSGNLPEGLCFDSRTGTISGTPTQKSTITICVCASNQHGSCSTEVELRVEDMLAPSDLKLSNDTDLIIGVPVAPNARVPILGVYGVPYTKFRISSTSREQIVTEFNDGKSSVQAWSLQDALAGALKHVNDINTVLKDADTYVGRVKASHALGSGTQETFDGLNTVLVSELDAQLAAMEAAEKAAAMDGDFEGASKIKQERSTLQQQVDCYRGFRRKVDEVHEQLSETHLVLPKVLVSVQSVQESLPLLLSSGDGVLSGLNGLVKNLDVLMEFLGTELAWMEDTVKPVQSACMYARNEVADKCKDFKLKSMVEGLGSILNQLAEQVRTAHQSIGSTAAALTLPTKIEGLQEAFRTLTPIEYCALVSNCTKVASELELLINSLTQENNQTISLVSNYCDGLVQKLQSLPVLPPSLSLDENTGLFSGTPTKIVNNYTYTLTAYNPSGQCSTTARLRVREQVAPSNLAYMIQSEVEEFSTAQRPGAAKSRGPRTLVIVGDPDVVIRLDKTFNPGLPAPKFTVIPDLPQGISIDADTGLISGSPTKETALCRYKVVAANAKGSCEFEIPLEVQYHVPPSSIQYVYSGSALTDHQQLYSLFLQGTAVHISPLITSQKGTHLNFSVTPKLPEGLFLSDDDGVISGTALNVQTDTVYTITASNKRGETSTRIRFAVIRNYKDVLVYEWTAEMVRMWLEHSLKLTDTDLLEFAGTDGRSLASCKSAEDEPLASRKLADSVKLLITVKIGELIRAKSIRLTQDLMSLEQIAEVNKCVNTAGDPSGKFYGARENLIVGDPAHAARSLEVFMNIEKDENWFGNMVDSKQALAIENEIRKLAQELASAGSACAQNGQVTDVFSTHLHYLTMIEGIKDSVKQDVVGAGKFTVIDHVTLSATLCELASELNDFLDYVMYSKASEKMYKNGMRDKGRPDVSFDYFVNHDVAKQSGLRFFFCVCVCTCVCIYICVYVRVRVYVCMCLCMCVCVCVYVCMYVCIYV
jgi:hypothetical protein